MVITDLTTDALIRIRVEGISLRKETTQEIKEVVKAHLAKKARDISFDLQSVQFIDSMSIGMLLYFAHLQKRSGHRVRIEAASAELKSLLRTIALDFLLHDP
ncbi:MAG: STAS domain-containing protein [Spirochaetes bacterium]|nr:STAS domain-containing protein [Spirochaetota bacterium]